MKTTFNKALIILCGIILISCGGPTNKSNGKLKFEQIGYFKGDNNLRYFTFWVDSDSVINPDSIPSNILSELKTHGRKQMNTKGQVTASFYYLYKDQVPDITLLTAQAANDIAHERKPIASVWIMPTGRVNIIENPE